MTNKTFYQNFTLCIYFYSDTRVCTAFLKYNSVFFSSKIFLPRTGAVLYIFIATPRQRPTLKLVPICFTEYFIWPERYPMCTGSGAGTALKCYPQCSKVGHFVVECYCCFGVLLVLWSVRLLLWSGAAANVLPNLVRNQNLCDHDKSFFIAYIANEFPERNVCI